jgi:predicted DNA-binding antitoxin AbrB/MazE fold protein
MTQHIDAIYDQGVFRPVEPLALPQGSRVHLRVESESESATSCGRIFSPRLVHPNQAADFVMEVREVADAGL